MLPHQPFYFKLIRQNALSLINHFYLAAGIERRRRRRRQKDKVEERIVISVCWLTSLGTQIVKSWEMSLFSTGKCKGLKVHTRAPYG